MTATSPLPISPARWPLPRSPYLGPARVCATKDRLVVAVDGCRPVDARPALAVPCRLEVGDEVLVVGVPDAVWVIGLFGERRHALEGERVSIRARGGALRVSAESTVHLAGRAVSLLARGPLVTAVAHASEAAATLERRVVDELSLIAREVDESIDGSSLVHVLRLAIAVRDAYLVQGRVIRAG